MIKDCGPKCCVCRAIRNMEKMKMARRLKLKGGPTKFQRDVVLKLIRSGKTTKQIVAYTKLSVQQVAAYRAHRAMGHYAGTA